MRNGVCYLFRFLSETVLGPMLLPSFGKIIIQSMRIICGIEKVLEIVKRYSETVVQNKERLATSLNGATILIENTKNAFKTLRSFADNLRFEC